MDTGPLSRGPTLGDIARVLQLIERPPNPRDKPHPGDLQGDFSFWFDGGACRALTGNTEYKFTDGTTAYTILARWLSYSIHFPDGSAITVREEPPKT